jgi:hypothetical protein
MKYPAIAIAAAMRLVEFLPRRDGECDPHRKTMAAELGQCERQISRGYAVLEADGWIMRRRGGHDAVIITLMIPPDDATRNNSGRSSLTPYAPTRWRVLTDLIRDILLSHMPVSR